MKIYRCMYCNYSVIHNKERKGIHSTKYILGTHYETKHKQLLPPDMDGYRFCYWSITGKKVGNCVMCKRETDFNRTSMKYSRFCNDPACKQKYKEERDRRMIAKYGKVYILDDPAQQQKMLQARKISGTYTWSDGVTKFQYVGTYELDFLKHLDKDLHWPVGDLVMPSPHTYTYKYKDHDHFYIPDAFIPSLNCEVEIKSSARHEKQNNPDSREKEKIKDTLMRSCSNIINYIKIEDKNYSEFNALIQKEEES